MGESLGDPAVLRDAARRMRGALPAAQDAARLVGVSRDLATSQWRGAAGAEFARASASTRARVQSVARLADVAPVLDTYADVVEECQREYDAAREASLASAARPDAAADRTAGEAAARAMTAAKDTLRRADEAAAAQIRAIAQGVAGDVPGAQTGVATANTAQGGGAAVVEKLLGADGNSATAQRTGDVLGKTSLVGGLVLNGTGQWLDDSTNPYYSNGERIGRAIGAAASQTATATLGSIAGASTAVGAVGGSAVEPGLGTVAGAAAGSAIGGYLGGSAMNKVNDKLVEGTGSLGDLAGDAIDHVLPDDEPPR